MKLVLPKEKVMTQTMEPNTLIELTHVEVSSNHSLVRGTLRCDMEDDEIRIEL